MISGADLNRHRHRKFYILMTTIVVGAILILMLINDQGELVLTGSSIGVSEDSSKAEEKVLREEGVEFRLDFSAIPGVQEETKFKSAEIVFMDLSTNIKINEEEMELKGLEQVVMEIEDFEGEVDFDELSISLKGEGAKITVNGIVISTKGQMAISFGGLVYSALKISDIELGSVDLGEGSGRLAIEEKMSYDLNSEEIKMDNFKGDLGIGLDDENLIVMEGEVSSLSIKGDFDLILN